MPGMYGKKVKPKAKDKKKAKKKKVVRTRRGY